ncbi:MAG: hypothetical protein ABI569_11095 [Casimicrobiaceae bacterium]
MTAANVLPDPRVFPDAHAGVPEHLRLYTLAVEALAAQTRQQADSPDREIRGRLAANLASDGAALAALFAGAPSVAVTRLLWRELDAVWRQGHAPGEAGLALTVFALPLVIVSGGDGATADLAHPGVLAAPDSLVAILREHGALGGSQAFALADALVSADAIDLPRLPEIFAWQALADSTPAEFSPRALPPAPLSFPAGREGVHLRFLMGSALARRGLDLVADREVGKWGVPFTKELSRQLAVGATSVLALARAPQRPLPAVAAGRAAKREIGAQIFAGNAIRKLRASVGEPSAVISAHRAPDAPGGGELRLSLSSPFAPRDAEGFRCPLYPLDRVGDVAQMLADLMADCRVTDVRIAAGVHADRDPATGLTLLFKPDTLPDATAVH